MEDENRPGEFYDIKKNSHECTCVLCECNDPKAHVCYWNCPIFENYKICATCCMIDTLRPGAEKKFSEKLGREITREEINAMCRKCGRNHAIESDEIADKITFDNTFTKVVEEKAEEKENEKKKKEDDGLGYP